MGEIHKQMILMLFLLSAPRFVCGQNEDAAFLGKIQEAISTIEPLHVYGKVVGGQFLMRGCACSGRKFVLPPIPGSQCGLMPIRMESG